MSMAHPPRVSSRSLFVLVSVAPMVLALGACRSEPSMRPDARALPRGAAQAEVVNIQVFRKDTTLELTNTTARNFGPGTLWINGRFSRKIDGIAIGQTLVVSLREFEDEYGDVFRAGGFFAADPPERVVLTQYEPDGTPAGQAPALVGFITVQGLAE